MQKSCLLVCLVLLTSLAGCAANNYQYGGGTSGEGLSPRMDQQIRIGNPHAFLDASDWIWPGSWLAKLILWNKNIDSHEVSQETIDEIAHYLQANELDNVQVLINDYRPGIQWRRLFTNREVGAGWRYTFGLLSTSIYTLLPGRFFGGDHFNPYTNTISIYSDDPAIVLHEGGHANDFSRRKHKGLHAALYALPGAPLYYEAVASNDALSYLKNECRFADQKHAYRVLHPAYGTYIGGTFYRQSPLGVLVAIPGHITGAIAAAKVDDNPEIEAMCLQTLEARSGMQKEQVRDPTSDETATEPTAVE